MAPFTFSAHPTDREIRSSLNHFFKGQFRLFRALGALLVVMGLISLRIGDGFFALLIILVGATFVILVPPITTWSVLRKMSGLLNRPTDYRIDEQGIFVSNDLAESLYRWRALDKLDELPGMLIARLGKAGFCAIPTGRLPLETASALTGFIRARVPA